MCIKTDDITSNKDKYDDDDEDDFCRLPKFPRKVPRAPGHKGKLSYVVSWCPIQLLRVSFAISHILSLISREQILMSVQPVVVPNRALALTLPEPLSACVNQVTKSEVSSAQVSL